MMNENSELESVVPFVNVPISFLMLQRQHQSGCRTAAGWHGEFLYVCFCLYLCLFSLSLCDLPRSSEPDKIRHASWLQHISRSTFSVRTLTLSLRRFAPGFFTSTLSISHSTMLIASLVPHFGPAREINGDLYGPVVLALTLVAILLLGMKDSQHELSVCIILPFFNQSYLTRLKAP